MLELMYKILIGHTHNYIMIKSINVKDHQEEIPSSIILVSVCCVCGKIKQTIVES